MATSAVSTSTTSSSSQSAASLSSAPILTPTIVAVIQDAVRREVNSAISMALAASSSSTIISNSIPLTAAGIHCYLFKMS